MGWIGGGGGEGGGWGDRNSRNSVYSHFYTNLSPQNNKVKTT